MQKIAAVFLVLALGLTACDKEKSVPQSGGGPGRLSPIVPMGEKPLAAPVVPTPPQINVVPKAEPKDTDVTCTGIYGTKPYHLIFKSDGHCWFQDTHGPDVCSFTMNKKDVHLKVGSYGKSGWFENDCSQVWFGGVSWTRTGPVPADK